MSPREARRLATRVMSEWERETSVRYDKKEREWEGFGAVLRRRKRMMRTREVEGGAAILAID